MVWTICATKIADFVFSISESLWENLDCLQNPAYLNLKQEKEDFGDPTLLCLVAGPLDGLERYSHTCTQSQGR